MAYSQTLNTTDPTNTEAVSNGAARIRNLAVAVSERLAATFTDINTEPMVLKSTAVPTHNQNASTIQAGTFAAGDFVFPAKLDVLGNQTRLKRLLMSGGEMRAARTTQISGGSFDANFSLANHVRVLLSGPINVVTLSGGLVGGVYTLELVQDSSGNRPIIWAADTGSVVWAGGLTPSLTTTANRKDVFTFFFDGTNYLGATFGLNFASTA